MNLFESTTCKVCRCTAWPAYKVFWDTRIYCITMEKGFLLFSVILKIIFHLLNLLHQQMTYLWEVNILTHQCCVTACHTPTLPVWLVATSWLPMKNSESTRTPRSNVPGWGKVNVTRITQCVIGATHIIMFTNKQKTFWKFFLRFFWRFLFNI